MINQFIAIVMFFNIRYQNMNQQFNMYLVKFIKYFDIYTFFGNNFVTSYVLEHFELCICNG